MKKLIDKLFTIFTSAQFRRYFVSGISAFLVDFFILNLQIYVFKFNPYIGIISCANLISSLFGMIVSYTLNRRYAFKSQNKNVVKEGGKFVMVVIANYIISNILFGFIVKLGIIEPITKVIVIGLQMIWTYFLYKSFVFRVNKAPRV